LLLLFLVASALFAVCSRDLLTAVIIFIAYSLVMALVWQMLRAPELAVAEAVVGAGATALLLLAAIGKTRRHE
ncbi:MAG TPA: cation:proton antiporter, partial [Firmicutes bacterium]|nr:cation:proton antiporter [Bacillota bacterium]